MTFKETLQPAIDYAEQGFPISERIAYDWRLPQGLPIATATRASAARSSIRTRSPRGTSTAERRRPARSIAIPVSRRHSASCSSRAATASTRARSRRRSSTSRQRLGGTMTLEDLADYSGEWVDAGDHDLPRLRRLHAAAAGADLGHRRDAEHPRGLRAEVGAGPDAGDARSRRLRSTGTSFVEAKKLAFNDLYAFNADPNFSTVPLERLLSKAHAKSLCARVNPNRAVATRKRAATPRAVATRSCFPPRIATATWWRGSTASIRASARA